ncbi:hypothetical protein CKF46_19515 [Klebsiella pneumoniae]|nr:hypothetical protein CKF46_19515 [Klebsiella pneumoniae]
MVTRISFSHLSKPGLWEAMTTEAWRGDDGLMKRRGKRRASGRRRERRIRSRLSAPRGSGLCLHERASALR